jgi:hypothetical protein
MTQTSRRSALTIGAAAVVLGPSVMFSRTAHAVDDTKLAGGLTAGNFAVKIDGVYDRVPGVTAVDLGSVQISKVVVRGYDPDQKKEIVGKASQSLSFSGLKLTVASKDAAKMTIKWAPEYTRQGKASGELKTAKSPPRSAVKISVSLLAADGKTPAVTYHANDAVQVSADSDPAGDKIFVFDVGSIDVESHPVPYLNRTRQKELLTLSFEASVEKLGTVSGFSMSKAVYDKVKVEQDAADERSLVAFVTTDRQPSALVSRDKPQPPVGKVKFWSTEGGATPPPKSLRFSQALLTSVDLPKLQVGSDALVTETLHFRVDP